MSPDRLSTTFSALADPTRRAILAQLASGEATVSELAEPFAMSLPGVSKHLKVLERAGLIARGRAAQWLPCRLEAAALKEVADWDERYRRFWEESFDRLDQYLKEVRAAGMRPAKPIRTDPVRQGNSPMDYQEGITADRELTLTRVFDAPRERVFEAWTNPEEIGRWWGPHGFTTTSLEMDIRPGGAYRACMRSREGALYRRRGVYRDIVPPERLAFTFAWADATGNLGHETLVTVTFAERGGKTVLTL